MGHRMRAPGVGVDMRTSTKNDPYAQEHHLEDSFSPEPNVPGGGGF